MSTSTRKLAYDQENTRECTRTLSWTKALAQSKNISLTIAHLQLSLVFEVHELIYVGRNANEAHDITVDLEPFGALEMGVSRQHLALCWRDEILVMIDNHSLNHTWVNGEVLVPGQAYPVYKSDRIKLGAFVLSVDFIPQT